MSAYREDGEEQQPCPSHPCVDWSVTEMRTAGKKQVKFVRVICPKCGAKRMMHARTIAHRIRWAMFTGCCKRCRVVPPHMNIPVSRHAAPDDCTVCSGGDSFAGMLTGEGRKLLSEYVRIHECGVSEMNIIPR